MRYLLIAWAAPLALFWGWYFLSLNDMNFGYIMLTRQMHDFVFEIYGNILGIDPATIPPLVAKACIFDSFFIVALYAFRRRRQIRSWWRGRRARSIANAMVESMERPERETGPYARVALAPYAEGAVRPPSA
ncbi:MAG: DUF6105 family protein [Hyphomicrobiales bacterium]|nr:DUF6105 family protein [Hyphomicrobiales bacterium]